jgi:hypothetical protein
MFSPHPCPWDNPERRDPRPETRDPRPETRDPRPETRQAKDDSVTLCPSLLVSAGFSSGTTLSHVVIQTRKLPYVIW